MNPEPGRRFGPYEILDRLGGGGMGHVYRAWDARLHREVALKLLHNEYAMPGMRERFLLEARAASALNHPNICTVFDIGEQNGDPYLVMELLEGESLKDRIADGPVERDDLLCIAREMAEALGAAHAKGVVHRDVKPGNVFLVKRPNGSLQAKILDFGLAKMERRGIRSAREADLTTLGATVGTLAYMSPEQARGETLDARSDLFSLGVVMYEMATGKIPFPGATSALVFVKLLNHPPEPVRSLNEAVPRELERVIQKLLAKDPAARFQTADEAEQAIRQVQDRSSSGAGWLRRAVDAASAGRGAKPISRQGRQAAASERLGGMHAVATPLPETVRPAEADPGVLRPVARVPEGKVAAGVLSQPLPPVVLSPLPSSDTAPRTPLPEVPAVVAPPAAVVREHVVDPLAAVPPSVSRPAARIAPVDVGNQLQLKWRRRRVALGILALMLLGAWLALRHEWPWRFGGHSLAEHDVVLLAGIENLTGDRAFDESATVALDLALQPSLFLAMEAPSAAPGAMDGSLADASQASRHEAAWKQAQRMAARAFVFGSIRNARAPFTLYVAVFDTANDQVLASVDSTVATEADLPAAIDAASRHLREKLGEPAASIARNSRPLAVEATESVSALAAFADAEDAELNGSTLTALHGFQQAVNEDPRFVQAQLGLARVYASLHAEVAAADAARRALAAADQTSDRTHALAAAAYDVDASGDLPRAAVTLGGLVATTPLDDKARALLARVLRMEGRLPEALATAQAGCSARSPLSQSCREVAAALAAAAPQNDPGKMLSPPVDERGPTVAVASLQPDGHGVVEGNGAGSPVTAAAWRYGISLDAAGRLAAGAELWRVQAAAAGQVPGLQSMASFLLAQGAIDRALLDDCRDGLPMAHQAGALPAGITATFDQGMTEALCGDRAGALAAHDALRARYPQSYLVNGYMLANLQAAMALRAGEAQAALTALEGVRGFDLVSPSRLLRGWACAASGQWGQAEAEFAAVLTHPGAAAVLGGDALAAAEVGRARAFAASGDKARSTAAYARLVELWGDGDQGQPLLVEAKAHSR